MLSYGINKYDNEINNNHKHNFIITNMIYLIGHTSNPKLTTQENTYQRLEHILMTKNKQRFTWNYLEIGPDSHVQLKTIP